MPHFWIHFKDRDPMCHGTAADEVQARLDAAKFGQVVKVETLPYPGRPRIDSDRDTFSPSDFPSFCLHPDRCAGRETCPRRYWCDG